MKCRFILDAEFLIVDKHSISAASESTNPILWEDGDDIIKAPMHYSFVSLLIQHVSQRDITLEQVL